jgi:oxygen-independent coproporphyrinogen-3 oxidase
MEYTLSEIRKLDPESLTVHSLALKRTAVLNQRYGEFKNEINKDMDQMLSLAAERAKNAGMEPYYLYRQKNIAGNLENVGYAKKGHECIYNVLIMEEKLDTFAAGAGGITRLLSTSDGEIVRIDRVENVKNVDEFITRIDEMLERLAAGVDSRSLL